MLKLNQKILFLFFGRALQAALAILAIRLMTELLPRQEVGHQYLINSIILWFSLVVINPVGMFVNRHLHEWKESRQLFFVVKQLNKYFFLVAMISLPIIYVVKEYLHVGTFLPTQEILIFIAVYLFFSTWFQTITSFFNLLELQKHFVFLNLLAQGSGLLFAIGANHFFRNDAICWMAGLLAGQILALLVGVKLFFGRFKRSEFSDKTTYRGFFTRSTFLFCYPIAITTLFMWFLNQGYRLIIERNLGADVLATVGVGLGLSASLAGVVEAITTQYYYPKYYAALQNSDLTKRREAWGNLWSNALAIYIPCCFLTISVSNLVVKVLTSKAYHDVMTLMIVGAMIELVRQLSNVAYLVSHGEKKTQKGIFPYLLGGLFLAGVLSYLIHMGVLSPFKIVVSLLGAGLIMGATSLFNVKRMINAQFKWKKIMILLVLSSPLVMPVWILSVNDSYLKLFVAAALSTLWCGTVFKFSAAIDIQTGHNFSSFFGSKIPPK